MVVAGVSGLRGVGGGRDERQACRVSAAGVGQLDLQRPVRQRVRIKFLGSVLLAHIGKVVDNIPVVST